MAKNIEFLFDALKKSDIPTVKAVVKNFGVDINCQEEATGITPLLRSIFHRDHDLVKVCIGLGADVNKVAQVDGMMISPIMRAIYQRDAGIVKTLIDYANIVITEDFEINGSKFTAFERAIYQGDSEIITILSGEMPTNN